MRLEILLTAMIFFGGTCLTGYTLRHVLKFKNEGIIFSVIAGTMFWWAVMELILVPMTMLRMTFSSFVWIYTIVIVVFSIWGCLFWKDILEDIKEFLIHIKEYLTLGHLVALGLICYQLYFIHHHMYLEWDDTYYVNLANEAIYSNRIFWAYPETGAFPDFDKRYVLSLWPIFYAWLAKLIGVIPTIMAHTILPWLIIPLAYMVYTLIGKELFPKDKQLQGMFLAMSVMLHLFMSGEHTSGITFLSITPWVGKGVLPTILIPVLFYWILKIRSKERMGEWVLLGISCLAGCLLSSTAIMLMPIFVMSTVLLLSVHKKTIRYIMYGIMACMPCIVLGIYYIYLTR